MKKQKGMLFLGIDLGTSFIKTSLFNAQEGTISASAAYPEEEAPILSPRPGWAEQNPEDWWNSTKLAVREVLVKSSADPGNIAGIGITYQMHGLVIIDKQRKPLRNAVIWCDSRAVEVGNRAMDGIGPEKCFAKLLNSPGNFTASKLKWVMENEPRIFERIDRVMLPGDYIAMKLSGEAATTVPGLSEGIFWDFTTHDLSMDVLDHFGFSRRLFPSVVPTFGEQGTLLPEIARELGLSPGIPVAYRAGDQPNNAFSLNVLLPGEVAATAGTSGVIYAVTDRRIHDPDSRINTFAHVNHRVKAQEERYGVLLCINGAGSSYRWIKQNFTPENYGYVEMNRLAAQIPAGSEGLTVLPFGNGAERVLGSRDIGCVMGNLDFNRHGREHVYRAVLEGVAFSMNFGLEVMKELGLTPHVIRAGSGNMFQSRVFCDSFSNVTGIPLELYDMDGASGAALGAAVGTGFFRDFQEAFSCIESIGVIHPDPAGKTVFNEAYLNWKAYLKKCLNDHQPDHDR